jgi:hypothetical protein
MKRNGIVIGAVFCGLFACGGEVNEVAAPVPPTPPSREAGVAAFETVRSVLQHPRCQNCHPAGDAPLQGDDGHIHGQNVLRGPTGHGMIGEECTTCHGPSNPPSNYGLHVPPGVAKGWHMPAPELPLVFVGVTPAALCEKVKEPSKNGGKDKAALRLHLDDPLVTWAWDPGFGRAPVPVPRAKFIEAWETWQNAGAPCPG